MVTFIHALKTSRPTRTLLLPLVLIPVGGSLAAESPAESTSDTIEEIVVTATFRETKLLDTPQAITALGEQTLIEKGVLNLQSLYQDVPGMNYSLKSNSYSNISIRGLTPPAGGGAVVGAYLDDIPITDSNDGGGSQSLQAIYDVQRVEVLKGPQGTLYGEGNMGGALRYITNRPDPSAFDASFRIKSSQEQESDGYAYLVNGMVNVPLLQDVLALRLSGQVRDDPGFLDTGPPRNGEDVNDTQENALRAKLAWYVTPAVSVDATVNLYNSEYGGPSISDVPYGNTQSTSLIYEQQFGNGGETEDTTYNLSLNWDLPWAHLLVSSSHYDRDIHFSEETSDRFRANVEGIAILFALPDFGPGAPNQFYVPGFPFPLGPVVESYGGGDGFLRRRTERTTHELRLVSTGQGPWQWTAGLYYKDDNAINGDVDHPGFENIVLTPGWIGFEDAFINFLPGSETENENTEKAVYGEASYDLTPLWNILLGVRFSNVTVEQVGGGFPEVDDSFVAPKATLTFRPNEDQMAYFTIAQGFRPGVLNSGTTFALTNLTPLAGVVPGVQEQVDFLNSVVTVDGDEIFNYELGYKATLSDGRLRGAASIYYMDWKDTLTANRFATLIGDTIYVDNAGDAHSQGVELELTAQLTDDLTLQFGGSWNTEAEIDSFADGLWTDVNGNNIVVGPGNRLASAPKFTGNIGLDYRFSVGTYSANARADWYNVGSQYTNVSNEIETPGYNTANLRITMVPSNGNWSLSLFGRNITGEQIIYENNEVGSIYGPSRTLGVEFSWNTAR